MIDRSARPHVKPARVAGALLAALLAAGVADGARAADQPQLQAHAEAEPLPATQSSCRKKWTDDRLLRDQPALFSAAQQYFPCDDQSPASRRIFRLTRDQIDASVQALLPGLALPSVKSVMARDPLQTNYEYADMLVLNAANLAAISRWAGEVAALVKTQPRRVVDCEPQQPSGDCLASAARMLVQRAFRGEAGETMTARLITFYLDAVKTVGFAEATGELVWIVLQSPDFLYRKETEVDRRGRLTGTQHLNQLTYMLADTPAEQLARRAPELGRPPQQGELVASIDAILATPEAREKLVRFFKSWLEVKEPADFTISETVYPEFTPTLAAAMVAETEHFLREHLSKPRPSLRDVTQSSDVFVSKPLELIYRAKAADPAGRKPVRLDPAHRLGVFSQPAVIASHSGPTDQRPIKRGVFWVRKVMCMHVDATPAQSNLKLEELPGTTERERIEHSTSTGSCPDCHKLINPFGFMLENYDALGRWRTIDNSKPIDSSISINFLDEDPVKTAGPVDALRTLTNSMMFKQCFARQMFRFYMGRNEQPSDDPVLRRMFIDLARTDDQDLLQALRTMATSTVTLLRR